MITSSGFSSLSWMSRCLEQAAISSGAGVPVVGRAAFQDICNVHVLSGEPGLGQELVEELAGGADEGSALLVFVFARGLSDQDDPGVGGSLAGDGVGAGLGQGAGDAAAYEVFGQFEGILGRRFLPLGGGEHGELYVLLFLQGVIRVGRLLVAGVM